MNGFIDLSRFPLARFQKAAGHCESLCTNEYVSKGRKTTCWGIKKKRLKNTAAVAAFITMMIQLFVDVY